MRLRTRFVLLITLAALAPLAVLGFFAVDLATERLKAKVTDAQARTATGLSELTDTWLDTQVLLLGQQMAPFDLGRLGDAERLGFLRLLYQQSPGVNIVSLLDAQGVDLAPGVYLSRPGEGELAGREAIDAERYRRFREAMVRLAAETPPGEVRQGTPYLPDGRALPVVVLVVRLPGGEALGVELAMDALARHFEVDPDSAERLALLDEWGRVALGDGSLVDPAAFTGLPADLLFYEMDYVRNGIRVLAASAAVPQTGWRVVVAEPMDETLAPARELTFRTAYVATIAALLSVILGLFIGRQITGPVLELRDAALQVAEGRYGRRVEGKEGGGELTDLSHAFNFMSRKLMLDRETIAAKNAEIEAFNRELQDRVDERTRQLREAQDQLVRSARLAAVGEMGAGLAHELNNPMAGILGLAQVLAARSKEGAEAEMLRSLEAQARRCTDIVAQLQRYSRTEDMDVDLDLARRPVVDLVPLVNEIVGLVGGSFSDRAVQLVTTLPAHLEVRGDRQALAQAVAQLITSIRSAAAPGARVSMVGQQSDSEVGLDLTVSGAPLKVGQDDWMASGMGFWAARQVLAAHGGRLLEPELPPGGHDSGTWRIRLPRA